MFCSKCGKDLENGTNFCSNCGNKVSVEVKKDVRKWVSCKISRLQDIISYVFKQFPVFFKSFIRWCQLSGSKLSKLIGIGIVVGFLSGAVKSTKYVLTSTFPHTPPICPEYIATIEQAEIYSELSSKYEFFVRTRKTLFVRGFAYGLIISILITIVLYCIILFLKDKKNNCLKVKQLLGTIKEESRTLN